MAHSENYAQIEAYANVIKKSRGLFVKTFKFSPSALQGGPSGRGQPYVDMEIRVALWDKKFIL